MARSPFERLERTPPPPGGGAAAAKQYCFLASPATNVSSGNPGVYLPWGTGAGGAVDGDNLFDFSNPSSPTAIASGLYIFSVTASVDRRDAAKSMWANLYLDTERVSGTTPLIGPTLVLPYSPIEGNVPLTLAAHLAAGRSWGVGITHDAGVAANAFASATVVFIPDDELAGVGGSDFVTFNLATDNVTPLATVPAAAGSCVSLASTPWTVAAMARTLGFLRFSGGTTLHTVASVDVKYGELWVVSMDGADWLGMWADSQTLAPFDKVAMTGGVISAGGAALAYDAGNRWIETADANPHTWQVFGTLELA
jgi:hypothetical protein